MARYSGDEFVCGACFNDDGLHTFCESHADSTECDFCGATSDKPIAAPLGEVIDHIRSTIYRYYDDPANAGLPYESAEGGYQGQTWCTEEIFDELGLSFPRDEDRRLADTISSGIGNDLWSEAEPFMLSPDQRLHYSWDEFCRRIKHHQRFFFLHQEEKKKKRVWNDDELYSPDQILKLIFSCAKDAGVFITLPAGKPFFRARHQPAGKLYMSAGTLGPPPHNNAVQTNRMSPPGVVMAYVADDRDTALAETATAPGTFAVGEFVADRDLVILDLTRLPSVPSVFAELADRTGYDPRPRLNFLHRISREISRPIARDDRVHVEYVPTQVVTEYVRTVVRVDGSKVDGIRYKSSRRDAGTALVLFADQNDLVLDEGERPALYFAKSRWLRLVKAGAMKVTGEDIKRWTDKPRAYSLLSLIRSVVLSIAWASAGPLRHLLASLDSSLRVVWRRIFASS